MENQNKPNKECAANGMNTRNPAIPEKIRIEETVPSTAELTAGNGLQHSRRRVFPIAWGESHCAKVWHRRMVSIDEMREMISQVVHTPETMAEYQAMTREQRTACKDHGGFVGGTLQGTERKKEAVLSRSVLTLDVDHAEADFLETYKALAEYESILYSTHSHTPENPRYRIIVFLAKDAMPDKFVAVSRYYANEWGIDQFDPCSWMIHQPMFWPSCPSDGEYVFEHIEGKLLDPDEFLAKYPDWRDCSKLPTRSDEKPVRPVKTAADHHDSKAAGSAGEMIQVQDPTEKEGVVGAFCRCYGIEEAINAFLPDIYQPAESVPGRYEYIPAESTAGVVLFDNKWAYSHHSTDPACGQMLNAFDLVRVHRFPDDDEKKSFHDMANFALALDAVKQRMLTEWQQEVKCAFPDEETREDALAPDNAKVETQPREQTVFPVEEDYSPVQADKSVHEKPAHGENAEPAPDIVETTPEANEPESDTQPAAETPVQGRDWKLDLEFTQMGELERSSINAQTILENDSACNSFAFNELAGRVEVTGPMPWSRPLGVKYWRDQDECQLKAYLDRNYAVFSERNHKVAFSNAADNRRFHPIRAYLDGLPAWDGVPRVETLLINAFHADDTPYVRAVTRKTLAAAVGRIYNPGIKFDNILVLDGIQGIGKSTLFKDLAGGAYYSETLSLTDMNDKTAAEKLLGYWIVEIAELAGMKKMDIEKVKAFLSTADDIFRPSYGHTVESHPRQCIMIATVNGENGYLRDSTGNRRFWVVKLRQKEQGKQWTITKEDRDQIWAEAKVNWLSGEKLYLESDLLAAAEEAQQSAMDVDERAGIVQAYLDTPLPENWSALELYDRIRYLHDRVDPNNTNTWKRGSVKRTTVSNAEIWCECFGFDKQKLDRKASHELADIMSQIPGWKRTDITRGLPIYGRQRIYERQELASGRADFASAEKAA